MTSSRVRIEGLAGGSVSASETGHCWWTYFTSVASHLKLSDPACPFCASYGALKACYDAMVMFKDSSLITPHTISTDMQIASYFYFYKGAVAPGLYYAIHLRDIQQSINFYKTCSSWLFLSVMFVLFYLYEVLRIIILQVGNFSFANCNNIQK